MFDALMDACRRPEPYEPGEELWNDPHIAQMMLKAHLDPDTDEASYRPGKIEAIIEYLAYAMKLSDGNSIVDLGCGPGLYCARLAAKGFCMTGVDRSENSIQYAKQRDCEKRIDYRNASYLDPFGTDRYDAAMMISQDFGVLNPSDRRILLENVRRALRPGGRFAFDVPSMAAYRKRVDGATDRWHVSGPGFWRPYRHIVMERTIPYPDIPALCDLYVVLDDAGATAYRVHQTFFSPESMRSELVRCGFQVEAILSNLCGEPYRADSPDIGILCKRD
jgi:SAM-dependent methyltransferase